MAEELTLLSIIRALKKIDPHTSVCTVQQSVLQIVFGLIHVGIINFAINMPDWGLVRHNYKMYNFLNKQIHKFYQ